MGNIGDKLTPQLFQLLAFLIGQLQTLRQHIQGPSQFTNLVLLGQIITHLIVTLSEALGIIPHNIQRPSKTPAQK